MTLAAISQIPPRATDAPVGEVTDAGAWASCSSEGGPDMSRPPKSGVDRRTNAGAGPCRLP
jgi:hypothetical protein